MQLAMYKGPARGWAKQLEHLAICAITRSGYSHAELLIDGICYSSSPREGGVRDKVIEDLTTSGRWDLHDVAVPPGMTAEEHKARALAQFRADKGKVYRRRGMLRTFRWLRWLPRHDATERFCSDEVAAMLGADDPETFTPRALVATFARKP